VQETFARLLQARPRLDDDALAPFAVVLARNVAVSFVRGRHTEKRHLHRLVDLREPDRPEERALQQEEVRAIAEGLARLPARDRTALVANEEGATPPPLPQSSGRYPGPWPRSSRGHGPSSGSTISWPSAPSTCRPTAASRSSTPCRPGDRRRQRALDAGGHLLDCKVCAALSNPLTERRRALAGFLPLGLVKPVEGARLAP
jgi:hypothetical protein